MTFVIVSIVGVALVAAGYLFVRGRSGDVRRENAGAPGAPPPMSEHEIGRQHIDQALDRLYPTQRDYRFGVSAEPGGDEAPLAEIVAYRASTPVPHWHYITYGLSELGEKTSTSSSGCDASEGGDDPPRRDRRAGFVLTWPK